MRKQIGEKDFENIYKETYLSTLKFIAIKCNNIDDINDILQDTYVELFRILKRKRNLEIQKYESYIDGIATNVIKRHYSKKKKSAIFTYLVNDEDENIDVMDNFNLEQDFITKDNAVKAWNYIKNKDLITAKIFYLYFVFGMKISEVAVELQLTESTVKNKIYRTLKELRKSLREDVINDE